MESDRRRHIQDSFRYGLGMAGLTAVDLPISEAEGCSAFRMMAQQFAIRAPETMKEVSASTTSSIKE